MRAAQLGPHCIQSLVILFGNTGATGPHVVIRDSFIFADSRSVEQSIVSCIYFEDSFMGF